MLNKKRGFTIIELLVAIAIIAILASLIIVGLNSARRATNKAKALTEFNQITLAMQLYYDKTGDWPNSDEATYAPGFYSFDYNQSGVPDFVPEFYPAWDANYYCSGCKYSFFIDDINEDGRPDCGTMIVSNGYVSFRSGFESISDIYMLKYTLCLTDACGSECGTSYSAP